MGEDFVKRLYVDQKPVITRERRQLTDWLARGTHTIKEKVRLRMKGLLVP